MAGARTGRGRRERRRRRLLIPLAIGAAGAVLLVGWLLLRPAPPSVAERLRAEGARGHPAPPRWPPGAQRPGSAPLPGPKREGDFRATTAVERVGSAEGAGPHLQRYNGRSGRLPADRTPGAGPTRAETASVGKQPELLVWLPSLRVGPEGTTIHARLVPPPDDRASAEIAVALGAERAPTEFRSMAPTAADSAAEFTWEYRAPASGRDGRAPGRGGIHTAPPQPVRYLVRVRARLAGEAFERTAGGLFYLHQPGGRLERPRIEREAGDLVLTVEAVIERAGSYWAYAELWGEGGERPVAFARERLANLPAGRSPVKLLFGGLVIRDSGVDGPYVVRNLRFSQVDTHPPHEAAPREKLPPTPAWRAAEFH